MGSSVDGEAESLFAFFLALMHASAQCHSSPQCLRPSLWCRREAQLVWLVMEARASSPEPPKGGRGGIMAPSHRL